METSKIKEGKSQTVYFFLFQVKFVKMNALTKLIRIYLSNMQIFEKIIGNDSFGLSFKL